MELNAGNPYQPDVAAKLNKSDWSYSDAIKLEYWNVLYCCNLCFYSMCSCNCPNIG